MVWLLGRLLVPFAANSVVCTSLLLIWANWSTDAKAPLSFHDFPFVILLIAPYQAVGLGLLVPLALFLCGLQLPRPAYLVLLVALGSALGIVVTLPVRNRPDLLEFILPAACGALSALIWFAFNRDVIKRCA